MDTLAQSVGPVARNWYVIRGTGSHHDGRLITPGRRLPLGVAPDRFGLIDFVATGEFERVSCEVYAEIVRPRSAE